MRKANDDDCDCLRCTLRRAAKVWRESHPGAIPDDEIAEILFRFVADVLGCLPRYEGRKLEVAILAEVVKDAPRQH